MKLKILTAQNTEAGSVELPIQFKEPLREDLISRAVLSIQAANRQPYGGYGDAGMRHSTKLSRRRRDFKGSYGKAISRVPRKIHTHRGMQFGWVGALAAGTVGGRAAHAPRPFSDWSQKINTQENRKAIRSAIAASVNAEIVAKRGHKLPKAFPFLIDDSFENIVKTSELETALTKIGFAEELVRTGVTRIRAGRGKLRGRKYKHATGALLVVSKELTPLVKAVANLQGFEVIPVNRLNAQILAPGTHPGRLTLYTKGAVERLTTEGLFNQSYKGPQSVKASKSKASVEVKAKVAKPKAAASAAPKKAAAKKAVKK